MTLGEGHDTPLCHGQQLCEILSRSNLAVRSYGLDMDFQYVCTVTLTLEIWPGSRSWHTLGSWTTIVWNYIQIGQGSMKLWQGHDVNRRTDRQTDRQTDRKTGWFLYTPKLCLRGGGGGGGGCIKIIHLVKWLVLHNIDYVFQKHNFRSHWQYLKKSGVTNTKTGELQN